MVCLFLPLRFPKIRLICKMSRVQYKTWIVRVNKAIRYNFNVLLICGKYDSNTRWPYKKSLSNNSFAEVGTHTDPLTLILICLPINGTQLFSIIKLYVYRPLDQRRSWCIVSPPFDWETTNQVILFNIPLYLECFVCFFNER